jgi:hypothetical protein
MVFTGSRCLVERADLAASPHPHGRGHAECFYAYQTKTASVTRSTKPARFQSCAAIVMAHLRMGVKDRREDAERFI